MHMLDWLGLTRQWLASCQSIDTPFPFWCHHGVILGILYCIEVCCNLLHLVSSFHWGQVQLVAWPQWVFLSLLPKLISWLRFAACQASACRTDVIRPRPTSLLLRVHHRACVLIGLISNFAFWHHFDPFSSCSWTVVTAVWVLLAVS